MTTTNDRSPAAQQNSVYELGGKRVWVAGHRGMVGSALVRRLAREGCEILTAPANEVDLAPASRSSAGCATARPQAVFVAAAKVGGILANDTLPGRVPLRQPDDRGERHRRRLRDVGVEKLLFLGSSCIYPKLAPQPIAEERAADRAARADQRVVRDRQDRRHQARARPIASSTAATSSRAMPTNLYGPGDNFDLQTSHVVPALIRKAHEAKAAGRRRVVDLGHGHAAARVPARRRLRRRLRSHHEDLFGRASTSTSARARIFRSRTSPS